MQVNTVRWIVYSCFVLSLSFGISGCGSGGEFPTAKVKGKVTRDGQAVPAGFVALVPIASGAGKAGKPASGAVQPDGSFVLSAVVCRHRVSYSPPPPPDLPPGVTADPTQPVPPGPYDGLVPKETEFEVKSGSNTLNVELVPDPNAAPAATGAAKP